MQDSFHRLELKSLEKEEERSKRAHNLKITATRPDQYVKK